MDSDDELELESGKLKGPRLNAKAVLRTRTAKGSATTQAEKRSLGLTQQEEYSIKKEAPAYKTPLKAGGSLLRQLMPSDIGSTALAEAIEDSDSDDQLEIGGCSQSIQIPEDLTIRKDISAAGESSHCPTLRPLENPAEPTLSQHAHVASSNMTEHGRSAQGEESRDTKPLQRRAQSGVKGNFAETPTMQQPRLRHQGLESISNSKGTPLSAQRQFLSSHLKPALLSGIPSSAQRPGTKKGLGPHSAQLQQLLKQNTLPSSRPNAEFEIQAVSKFQDICVAKSSILSESITVGQNSFSEAFVMFRPELGAAPTEGMRLKSDGRVSKFVGQDGLFICLETAILSTGVVPTA